MTQIVKPSRKALESARGKPVPDIIAHGLTVLFAGINPGLYSGATGHHFARPGNRFWRLLHAAGFTPRLLNPFEEERLLELGYGITNLVNRTTASAREVSTEELRDGGRRLLEKVSQYYPCILAVLGVEAYRKAFSKPEISIGAQPDRVDETAIWVLPNPSGANARYQFPILCSLFRDLRNTVTNSGIPQHHPG